MKFTEQAKYFTLGTLVSSIILTTISVAAARQWAMREITYGDISVVVHDTPVSFPHDQQPFITEDRVFLSIRSLSEALNIPITWNDSTRTVFVGEATSGGENNSGSENPATNLPPPTVPQFINGFASLEGVTRTTRDDVSRILGVQPTRNISGNETPTATTFYTWHLAGHISARGAVSSAGFVTGISLAAPENAFLNPEINFTETSLVTLNNIPNPTNHDFYVAAGHVRGFPTNISNGQVLSRIWVSNNYVLRANFDANNVATTFTGSPR